MTPRLFIALGFMAGLAGSFLVGGVLKPFGSDASASSAGPAREGGPRRPATLAFAGTEETTARALRLDALFDEKSKSAWHTEISRWGRDDPAAAWDQVWKTASVSWLRDHPEVLLRIGREWALHDPAAFKIALLGWKDDAFGRPSDRWQTILARLLVPLARLDPAGAFDVARQKSGALVEYTSAFLREFSAESPTEAGRLAASLPAGETRDRAVIGVASRWAATGASAIGVASRWAETDPSASLAFAQANLAPRQYRRVLDEALKRLVNVDAAALAPALAALPPGQYRAGWIERVTTQWMGTDREACTAWLESLPPGPDRELALHKSAVAIAHDNPREAIEMARSLSSTSRQRAVVFSALSSWAKTDATAAIAYAQSLPDDQTRVDALKLLEPSGATFSPDSRFGIDSDFQVPPLWETPAAGVSPVERKTTWFGPTLRWGGQ